MPQVIIQQGQDLIVELPITNSGGAVDLTSAAYLRAQLYITVGNVKKKYYSYSSTSKSGYGTCRMKVGNGNTNILQILIKRSESSTFDVGVLSFAVVTNFSGGSDFPQGINTEYDFPSFGTVVAGDAKDELIP